MVMSQIYVGPALTVAESPGAFAMGLPMTALQQSGSLLNSGAKDSARLYAGLANTNMKCVTFSAVCIHADLLKKEELLIQALKDPLHGHLNDACASSN